MPGPKSDKIWADAIRKHVHEYHEETDEAGKVKKTRYINRLAANLVKIADKGEAWANIEIGNRLDGKPAQSMTVAHERTADEMSDEELLAIIQSRGRNGAADKANGKEKLPIVH